jgi:LuxR family maltose regulon positive regulatory protein
VSTRRSRRGAPPSGGFVRAATPKARSWPSTFLRLNANTPAVSRLRPSCSSRCRRYGSRRVRRPRRHSAGSRLRIVATTRRDPPWPLHRLRLAGVLTEIRAADLAFREDETQTLLDRLGIDLDPVYVGRLVERTEGWAAGLRLAALELQGAADPAGFAEAFSGDDHAVAAYLLDEVIDRLAPELLDFLERVSVLDVVSADLAEALTGGHSGAATLADLAASNLFVHAVGPAGQWYRLHRLLADVLRSRITEPRTLRDLHRRATEWYLHQKMPLEAVRYALHGGLWPLAAEVLGRHVLALVVRGNPRNLDVLLSAVPRDALLSHPELAAALAGARIIQGSPAEVGELIAAAHAGASRLPGPRAERLRVILHLIEIAHARPRGDLLGVAAACRQIPTDTSVLAALGLTAWDVIPTIVLGNAGTAALWTGDGAEAEEHLRTAGEIDTSGEVLRPQLNAAAHLALLHCERGDLDAAQNEAHAVVEYAVDAGWTVAAQVVAAYLTLAWVALDRGDYAEADGWLGRVAQVEAVIPEPHVQLAAAGLTAHRWADAGDLVGALSGLQLTTARLAGSTPRRSPTGCCRWKLSCCAGSVTSDGRARCWRGCMARPQPAPPGPWPACICPPGTSRPPRRCWPSSRTTARRCAGVWRAPSCAA